MTSQMLQTGTADGEDMLDLGGKYLTFALGQEGYGIQILKVHEIIKMLETTKVPRTPAFVEGVINLRGKIIPVVDLRLKFGMEKVDHTEKTCIVVVQVTRDDDALTMGVIVDEVSEVLDVPSGDIEPAPSLGTQLMTEFILGMAKTAAGVLILLDIDRVLSAEEMADVGSCQDHVESVVEANQNRPEEQPED